ncbi:MAG: hypothetical protein ACXW27_13180, partial [Allosphingosinicella sp.]
DRRMAIAAGAIRAPKLVQQGEMKMKRSITLALAAAFAAPAAVAAQPATSIAVNCGAGAAAAGGEAPNLHGHWDFLMVPRGTPSFGLMSIGFVGADYGGSLAPARTAPVVLRGITLTGDRIHMVVASREGDVLFDGRLSARGDLMCGTVTYHGGETFPMVAQKRPST